MNCPAYEDCDYQATSEDHTYECVLFSPEGNYQKDSDDEPAYVID